jgi:hypothetical protein
MNFGADRLDVRSNSCKHPTTTTADEDGVERFAVLWGEKEGERERERETDRQRQTDRQTDRQRQRETETPTETQRETESRVECNQILLWIKNSEKKKKKK